MKRVRHFVCAVAWLASCALAARAAAAQQQQTQVTVPEWQQKAGGAMEFDVASVRQNKGDNPRPDMNFPMGPGDVYGSAGGLLRATDLPLLVYIGFAYKVNGNLGLTLEKQLPEWALSDRFDIEAHADGKPTKDQMRLMMQALLKERFGFAMHYEMRDMPVYALEIAKPEKFGPQLRPHPADVVCANQFPVNQAGRIEMNTNADGFPAVCGGIVGVPSKTPGTFALGASNITMKLLAEFIPDAGQLGRPVLDQTGLKGTYDFWLEFAPEQMTVSTSPGVNTSVDSAGPSLIEALKEQLGLKLESQKGQVEEIVVDHIDHPTAN
jgi:uncharacterized protein (TIGR03435 family)